MAPPRPKSRADEAGPSTMNGGSGGGGAAPPPAAAAAAAGANAGAAFDPAFDLNAFLSADPSKLTAPIPTVKDKYELVPAFLQVRDSFLVDEIKGEKKKKETEKSRWESIDCPWSFFLRRLDFLFQPQHPLVSPSRSPKQQQQQQQPGPGPRPPAHRVLRPLRQPRDQGSGARQGQPPGHVRG